MLAVKNLLCVPSAFKASSIHLQSKRILKHTTLSCSERKLFAEIKTESKNIAFEHVL